MRIEPIPLRVGELRAIMIKIIWRHGSWLERLFHTTEILCSSKRRIHYGEMTISSLWSQMIRFLPSGTTEEQFFVLFVKALPHGEKFSQIVSEEINNEINRRSGIQVYSPDGWSFRLPTISQSVARNFSGLLRFRISP